MSVTRRELLRAFEDAGAPGLTATDLMQRFDLAPADVETVVQLLNEHGLVEFRFAITERGRRRLTWYEGEHRTRNAPPPPGS